METTKLILKAAFKVAVVGVAVSKVRGIRV